VRSSCPVLMRLDFVPYGFGSASSLLSLFLTDETRQYLL
jgi:hypothetical protein